MVFPLSQLWDGWLLEMSWIWWTSAPPPLRPEIRSFLMSFFCSAIFETLVKRRWFLRVVMPFGKHFQVKPSAKYHTISEKNSTMYHDVYRINVDIYYNCIDLARIVRLWHCWGFQLHWKTMEGSCTQLLSCSTTFPWLRTPSSNSRFGVRKHN